MSDNTINHFKYHFKKWNKYRWLVGTSRLSGYHGAHHVETISPIPVPVYWELINLRAQIQAMQISLSKKSYPLTHSLKQCHPPSCSSRWSPERTHHPLSPLHSLLTDRIMDSLLIQITAVPRAIIMTSVTKTCPPIPTNWAAPPESTVSVARGFPARTEEWLIPWNGLIFPTD